jgi:hypothetical protein
MNLLAGGPYSFWTEFRTRSIDRPASAGIANLNLS